MDVCVVDRKPEHTFDFRFLLSASYFLSNTSYTDDGLQLREGGERGRLQQYDGTKEIGGLGSVRETGREWRGARPVVHLEEKEGTGRDTAGKNSSFFRPVLFSTLSTDIAPASQLDRPTESPKSLYLVPFYFVLIYNRVKKESLVLTLKLGKYNLRWTTNHGTCQGGETPAVISEKQLVLISLGIWEGF